MTRYTIFLSPDLKGFVEHISWQASVCRSVSDKTLSGPLFSLELSEPLPI